MTQSKKTLVVVTHPHLEQSRINKRLVQELEARGEVTVHKLYDVYPDERFDVRQEQQRLEEHDRIVLQFPFFWYSGPYLLKKWLDEVFLSGWAYGPGGDHLAGKELCVAISTGGELAAYQAGGRNQFSYSELLKPFQATANRVEMIYKPAFIISGVREVSDEQLERYASEYGNYVSRPS